MLLNMGLESQWNELPKDPMIIVQGALAKIASGSQDRRVAMAEWLEGGDSSLATRFGKYIGEHPDEPLDLHNEDAMRELMEKIRTYHCLRYLETDTLLPNQSFVNRLPARARQIYLFEDPDSFGCLYSTFQVRPDFTPATAGSR